MSGWTLVLAIIQRYFPITSFDVNLILGNMKIQVEMMIAYIRSCVRSWIGTLENFVFLGMTAFIKLYTPKWGVDILHCLLFIVSVLRTFRYRIKYICIRFVFVVVILYFKDYLQCLSLLVSGHNNVYFQLYNYLNI